jgi:hypothetical protein
MTARPAESGAVAGAVALLIGHFAGIDDAGVLTAMGVVIGFIPAAITWIVNTFRKKGSK